MELVNTDFQCNGRQPLGAPSPSTALGSLAFGFGIRPSSVESQTSPVFGFFSKAAVWKAPRAAALGDVQPPAPKARMPEGQTQPNIWILGPVKPTAGPLAGFSSVPWNILAGRRHGLSNL